ncbi:protease S8 tripeptidyl peptidase I, putative [Talaromyces stipitatus ATCC 10500]|nr:protease S8 tripeptidyl peptidase I, putative [Talaromyces stipitatus ATCC 10500]EED17555.1 protease S8 tripeptidyl peptidase I, putative [Talaromyces stipitatus ATCC 10500]
MVRSVLVPLALFVLSNLSLPFFTLAAPSTSYATVEGFDSVPSGWEELSPASPTQVLNLRLSLVPANRDNWLNTVLGLSTPGHATYGKFMSAEQLKELIAPSSAASDSVTSWLTGQKLHTNAIQDNGNWLALQMTVEHAENLLQTKFYDYKSTTTGEIRTLTLQYSIPKPLAGFIETIQPTTDFTEVQGPQIQAYGPDLSNLSSLSNESTPSPCNTQITPACLQSLYGLPTASSSSPGAGIVVPGFLNEYDLGLFLKTFRPDLNPPPSFTVESVDRGLNDQSKPGVEANLDIQYTVGLANEIQTTFISSGLSTVTGFLDVISYIVNQAKPPSVLSLSYGFNENALSSSAANSMCNAFAQLGARGISVIVASGDGGVAGIRPSSSCNAFIPTFPASCPYVTTVGATAGVPEIGAALSAGGFSNIFTRPFYQELAVDGYLAGIQSQYNSRFNASGRGYPDVAAQGERIVIEFQGSPVLVDGTSPSAPIFASTIALLNSQRLVPLGFLDPWLYLESGVLSDITSGSNPGCNTNGFPAAHGWDHVTGLGTPNFANMQLLMSFFKSHLRRSGVLHDQLMKNYDDKSALVLLDYIPTEQDAEFLQRYP